MAAIKEKYVDWFVLTPKTDTGGREIWGEIDHTDEPKVYIRIFEESVKKVLKSYRNESYDLHFQVNRTSFQYQHLALEQIEAKNLFPILINNPEYTTPSMNANAVKYQALAYV